MKINEEHLVIKKTARYFTNSPSEKISSVNFVIHGYATLAGNFITEFEFLDNDNTLIIAPEGLSKFYSRDKPSASWMTKEDRINEINDYINFLDDVFEKIRNEFNISDASVNLIGYSQGVHTAVRWFTGSRNYFNKLILFSSDFPRDADFEKLKKKLNENSKMYYVYGKQDFIISQKLLESDVVMLTKNEIKFEKFLFDAGHVIDKHTLTEILEKN